jgi:hypothetical protein
MIDIQVGEVVKRSELHDEYGGSRQGGICPARGAHAIFLFTDPQRGAKHGYRDGWGLDGKYHYCAQGTSGNQTMKGNNLAVLNHVTDGRPLYLFESAQRSYVRLVGEFHVDSEWPYYFGDSSHSGDVQDSRQMIYFRLSPSTSAVEPAALPTGGPEVIPPSETVCEFVPIERHATEEYSVTPTDTRRTARRIEAELVTRYSTYLALRGHRTSRNRIIPAGEATQLYTDLFDHTENVLVEAKGNATRTSVRMAVGQLFDYRRYISPSPRLAVLFRDEPRDDLRDFCTSVNIATIWSDGSSSTRSILRVTPCRSCTIAGQTLFYYSRTVNTP